MLNFPDFYAYVSLNVFGDHFVKLSQETIPLRDERFRETFILLRNWTTQNSKISHICPSLVKPCCTEIHFLQVLFSDAFIILNFAVYRERRNLPAPGAVYFLYRLWHSRSGHALCSVLLQNKVRAFVQCVCFSASVLFTAFQFFSFSPLFEAVVISRQVRTVLHGQNI